MVTLKPRAYGMKICKVVCYIAVFWCAMWIPVCSRIRLCFVWYMWITVCFDHIHNQILITTLIISGRIDPVTVGNTQRDSQGLSS